MLHDVRYALRSLRRSPVFTAVAILSLALGIGANTAIFTLLDQALIQSLPVRNPERLVVLSYGDLRLQGMSSSDNSESVFSLAMYREIRNRSDLFEGVVARGGLAPVLLQRGGGSDYVAVEIVSGNYFETLGVQAVLGRALISSDDVTPGGHPVVVLTHQTWLERFGGDPGVVGGPIRLNGMQWTVAGVLPPRFFSAVRGNTPGIFVPLAMQKQIAPDLEGEKPDVRFVNLIARLRAGVSREQADAAIQSTWQAILEERLRGASEDDRKKVAKYRLSVLPGAHGIDTLRRSLSTPLTVLMATVGMVLLIACVNLAGLLLARAAARQRDTAIRLSIGAGRGRIIRQALMESFVLALAGGALGLLAANWLTQGLIALTGRDETVFGWYYDWRVVAFATVVSLTTALLFGSVPALQTLAADVSQTLKSQSGAVAPGHARIRKSLVAGQVALATLLLFGAGLFARSLLNLMRVDPGFRAESVTTFVLSPRQAGYDVRRGNQFYSDLLARLRQMPGVTAASAVSPGPMTGNNRSGNVTITGYTPPPGEEARTMVHSVAPGWFATMGVPVLAGREITEADREGAPKVIVVNEAFARKYGNGPGITGQLVAWGAGRVTPDMQIVGVVADVRTDLREAAKPAMYVPYEQEKVLTTMNFYVRTAAPGQTVAALVRNAVRALDPDLPVYQLRTMREQLDRTVSADRTMAILCTAFGALAVLLTAIGIYGVIAWTVARRTSEIALRVALGALPARVLRLVLREAVLFTAVGIAVGVALALSTAQIVESKLFGVTGRDPLLLAGAVVCTAAIALLAAFIPALRATRVDPAQALRAE